MDVRVWSTYFEEFARERWEQLSQQALAEFAHLVNGSRGR